jgi:hypothetical protein
MALIVTGRMLSRLVMLLLAITTIAGLTHHPHDDYEAPHCVECACLPSGRRRDALVTADVAILDSLRAIEAKATVVRDSSGYEVETPTALDHGDLAPATTQWFAPPVAFNEPQPRLTASPHTLCAGAAGVRNSRAPPIA